MVKIYKSFNCLGNQNWILISMNSDKVHYSLSKSCKHLSILFNSVNFSIDYEFYYQKSTLFTLLMNATNYPMNHSILRLHYV